MANILVHFPGRGAVSPVTPANAIGSGALQPPVASAPAAAPRVVTGIDQLHWVDPVVANTLMQQFASSDPVPKDQLKDIPIALSEPVDKDTLFQSAQDPNKYYYLPHFQVRGDAERIAVRFGAAAGSTGWQLDVKLEEFKPQSLRPPPLASLNALDPSPTRVYLMYNTPYGTAPNRDFQSFLPETIDGTPGYKLSMAIDTIALRDDIFFAMTTPASKCQIVVIRNPKIAVPDDDSQYRIESPAIAFSVAPFCFPYETHHGVEDIYSFVPNVLESSTALRPVKASYLGTPHDYFQDPIDSTRIRVSRSASRATRSRRRK